MKYYFRAPDSIIMFISNQTMYVTSLQVYSLVPFMPLGPTSVTQVPAVCGVYNYLTVPLNSARYGLTVG